MKIPRIALRDCSIMSVNYCRLFKKHCFRCKNYFLTPAQRRIHHCRYCLMRILTEIRVATSVRQV